MNRYLTKALAFAALAAALPALAVEVDGIAAKVGEVPILRSEIIEDMRRMGAAPDRYEEFRDLAVERKLILKAAKESKMTMQEWVVENRVREMIDRNFEGDRNKLMDLLSRQKISYPEWYAKLREDLIIGAMRYQVVDKNITATPAETRKEYADHPDRYAAGRKATISVILLKPEEAPKRNEIENLLKTEPFGDLAKRFSSDSHAAEGGVWKDVNPRDVFKPEVCEEIDRMPKGTLSHWIEIDGWSFLLRKDADTPGAPKSFEDAYDDIVSNVKARKTDEVHKAWIDRLKAETYIKIY